MQELVEEENYSLEEHFVETGDGYVLGVYRIPYGRDQRQPTAPSLFKNSKSPLMMDLTEEDDAYYQDTRLGVDKHPPVILQHGLLDSSATWVLNRNDQSLGFILADSGWDVWMSNSRGNAFSRNHTGLLPDTSANFWDFTWADMADYDIPAVVDYVLKATDSESVVYIGHSQGCTLMLAALASNPALRLKISLFVALAPAAYVRYVTSLPMITLAQLQVDQLFNLIGSHEFLPARKETADIFRQICEKSPLTCSSVMTAICGFNANNLNLTRLPTYVEYAPSGTSVKNMAHWAQMVRQSWETTLPIFRRFDYGKKCVTSRGFPRNCNKREYGTDTAPEFDLGQIKDVLLAIFTGVQDRLADPVDVEMMLEKLPKQTVVHYHSELSFEHLDFTWGLSASQLIYPQVLELLDTYGRPKTRMEQAR